MAELHPTKHQEFLMKSATTLAVVVALILVVIKYIAWVRVGSVSIFSSTLDSLLDLLVSFVNLLAVRYALIPPDEDHRFGHTAAEDVAAFAQSFFIFFSGAFVAFQAVRRLIDPQPLAETGMGIAVMLVSMALTLFLVFYQRYVIRIAKSSAIEADSMHYISDFLVNSSVVVALLLSSYNLPLADPLIALAIAGYILYSAWNIGRNAFDKLLDKEFEDDERQKIIDTIEGYDGVYGVHALKTRRSGSKGFIQCHVDLNGAQSLDAAHKIADSLEKKLRRMFPRTEVLLHQDPVDMKKKAPKAQKAAKKKASTKQRKKT
jgi:ferrous-iron efflux pump FieF